MPAPAEPDLADPLTLQREEEHVSLCELLDRVLTKGVVVRGDIVITVADIELLYLGVQLVLSSTETARQAGIRLPQDMRQTIRDVQLAQDMEAEARALDRASVR